MAVPLLSTFVRGFQHGAGVLAFFEFLLAMIGDGAARRRCWL
jgi:hypothetical protein